MKNSSSVAIFQMKVYIEPIEGEQPGAGKLPAGEFCPVAAQEA